MCCLSKLLPRANEMFKVQFMYICAQIAKYTHACTQNQAPSVVHTLINCQLCYNTKIVSFYYFNKSK